MNKTTLFLIFLLMRGLTFAQTDSSIFSIHKKSIDQWKDKLSKATSDTTRINILQHLNFDYETENPDSSIHYGLMALELCRSTHNLKEESRTLNGLSSVYSQQGNFAEALDLLFRGRQLAEQTGHSFEVARSYRRTGSVYWYLEDYKKAVQNGLIALELDEKASNRSSVVVDRMLLASAYESWNILDSGLYYGQLALKDSQYIVNILESVFNSLGSIYFKKDDYLSALHYYRQGLAHAKTYGDFRVGAQIMLGMSMTFDKMGQPDSALRYALLAFSYSQKVFYKRGIMLTGRFLSELYDSSEPSTALKYLRISTTARDSLYGADNTQTIQSLVAREENRRRESEAAAASYRGRVRLYALLAGAAVLLIIAFILYRNNNRQKKVNLLLRNQKQELEKTVSLLKTTQSQLIQSEKMASLGQLTAGIAHEIQNPLNFVNNFSELNEELIDEATQNLHSGNLTSAQTILNDLRQNLRKIGDHGKRADAIVKSMLQHSRSGSGKIEMVNLNDLVTRYLSLSRHSLAASDHGFIPVIHTEMDDRIGGLSLVPEDIGRVLVNLFENGFQALRNRYQASGPGYEPTLTVKTRKLGDQVEIKVEDNGEGISPSIINKIFQPFFTTRPPGQGTGLGLSLSYDIISKGYHGELKVESTPGQGSVFTILLPDQDV